MKACKKCEIQKELKEFPITGKGYISGKCKTCISIYKRANKQGRKVVCPKCSINKCSHDAKTCRSCASKALHKKVNSTINKKCSYCGSNFIDDSLQKRKAYCSSSCSSLSWYGDNKHLLVKRYKLMRIKWHKDNKDHRVEYHKQRLITHSHLHAAKTAKRRASKLNATPKWLTKDHINEMKATYKEARDLEKKHNVKYHVDHIVPLQGKMISGLHVPWNLRVITAKENLKKSNKLDQIVI